MKLITGSHCILLFLLVTEMGACQQPGATGPGYTFELFRNTPVYALSKAVAAEDTAEIGRLVRVEKLPVDYKEGKFGQTLLVLAVATNKDIAAGKLLELGASPNARTYSGGSPFLDACLNDAVLKDAPKVLGMLIKYGADLNAPKLDTTLDQFGQKKNFQATPLELLCVYGELSSVKFLVEHGARLDSYGPGVQSILSTAVTSRNWAIARYLLIDAKAPIPDYAIIRMPGTPQEKKMTITDVLTEKGFAESAEDERLKGEMLAYLKSEGKR
jgi:uncharacterized protein